MNLKRIARLLKLLQTLQAGSGQNADALAGECEVSRRTIFRDLETPRTAEEALSIITHRVANMYATYHGDKIKDPFDEPSPNHPR